MLGLGVGGLGMDVVFLGVISHVIEAGILFGPGLLPLVKPRSHVLHHSVTPRPLALHHLIQPRSHILLPVVPPRSLGLVHNALALAVALGKLAVDLGLLVLVPGLLGCDDLVPCVLGSLVLLLGITFHADLDLVVLPLLGLDLSEHWSLIPIDDPSGLLLALGLDLVMWWPIGDDLHVCLPEHGGDADVVDVLKVLALLPLLGWAAF